MPAEMNLLPEVMQCVVLTRWHQRASKYRAMPVIQKNCHRKYNSRWFGEKHF